MADSVFRCGQSGGRPRRFTRPGRYPKGRRAARRRGSPRDRRGVRRRAPRRRGLPHLYVLWVFDRVDGYDLIAWPPSDDRSHGVFATRSPRRPNPIGLTTVEVLGRDGASLRVRGVDMLDGTPILDIKPFLSNVPPDRLRRGWLAGSRVTTEAGRRSRASKARLRSSSGALDPERRTPGRGARVFWTPPPVRAQISSPFSRQGAANPMRRLGISTLLLSALAAMLAAQSHAPAPAAVPRPMAAHPSAAGPVQTFSRLLLRVPRHRQAQGRHQHRAPARAAVVGGRRQLAGLGEGRRDAREGQMPPKEATRFPSDAERAAAAAGSGRRSRRTKTRTPAIPGE